MTERTVNVVLKGDGSSAIRAVLGVDAAVEKLGDDVAHVDRKMKDTLGKQAKTKIKIEFDVDGERGSGGVAAKASRAGKAAGDSFTSGLTDALSVGTSSPYAFAGLVTLAAEAAPLIATVLNAGILTGLGGGVIAGGIALAMSDPRVSEASDRLSEKVGATWRNAASVFVAPVERSLNRLGELSDKVLAGGMRKNFELMAPYVDKLMTGVDGFVMRALPGINTAVTNLRPVLDGIARGLPELGDGVGDFFAEISKDSERMGHNIENIMKATGSAIRGLGVALSWLSSRFSDFQEFTMKVRSKVAHSVADAFAGIMPLMSGAARAAGVTADAQLKAYTSGMPDAAGAAEKYSDAAMAASESSRMLGMSWVELAKHAGDLGAAMDKLNAPELDYFEATTRAAESTNSLKAALDASGGSIATNTTEGLKARNELSSWIHVQQDMIKATEAQVTAQHGATAGAVAAKAQYESSKAALIEMAMAAGMSGAEILGLVEAMFKMPATSATGVSTPGAAEAKQQIEDLDGKIRALEDKKVEISQNGAPDAAHSVAILQRQIEELRDRQIQIRTTYITEHITTDGFSESYRTGAQGSVPRRWGGVTVHAATGALRDAAMFPGGPTRYAFAEPSTGGEAFVPRKGDYGRSMSILSQAAGWYGATVMPGGAAGGGAVNVRVTLEYPDGRVAHQQIIAYADNTGRSAASLWPVG